MRAKRNYRSVVALAAVLSPISGALNSAQGIREEPALHYIIVGTDIMNSDDPNLARRSVTVLMDDGAFSTENLTVLFDLLSKRFKEPDWIQADGLHTYSGFMSRHSGNEFVRYNPEPGSCEWKTVVLRGDPTAT